MAFLLALTIATLATRSSASPVDRFWDSVALSYLEVERFESIEEMAAASDAVVVGAIESVSPGRIFGSEGDWVQYVSASVRVHQVLRGSLPTEHAETLTLEIQLPEGMAPDAIRSMVPQPRSILFLRNKGVEAGWYGYSEASQAEEREFYRLVIQRGVLADVGGRVHAPGWSDHADFVSSFEGRPFDELVTGLAE